MRSSFLLPLLAFAALAMAGAVPAAALDFGSFDADSPPFSTEEVGRMRGYFLQNVNYGGNGAVLASPDATVPGGGSYRYAWARDAALSNHQLLRTATSLGEVEDMLKSYVTWVLGRQSEQDPNVDPRVEPKWNLDGSRFTGGWCRPQTDGPGLRARTLTDFANALIASGQDGKAYVGQYLWTGSSSYNGGAIKYDLDWIVSNWNSNGCDLWEEVQSNDFFWNRMTMKKGLIEGSKLAAALGDSASAATYMSTASAINATLPAHYNGNYIQESNNRQQDAAVICALNNAYADDGLFAPTDGRVANTITTLNNLFYNTFAINQQDTKNGIPGILYGRYQGDSYGGGSPWILLTNALAEQFYRGANHVLRLNARTLNVPGQIEGVSDWDLEQWRKTLPELSRLEQASGSPATAAQLAGALASSGDGVLIRVRYHVQGADFHLSEQLDRNTGYESSATDLTWSYATLLSAMFERNQGADMIRAAVAASQ